MDAAVSGAFKGIGTKVEGEVGNKKQYDPRAWSKKAENAMTDRIIKSIKDLRSEGKSILT